MIGTQGCDMIETKDIHNEIEIKIKTKTEITHIVPQEDANEIARGPPNDASVNIPAMKKRKFQPCRLFLQSKRARRSIPEAEAHFFQVPVTSTNVVPRDDDADGIGQGYQMNFSDNGIQDVNDDNNDHVDVDASSCQPLPINDAEKKESPMPESSDDDDGSYFDFDIDDFADFDDNTKHDNEDDNSDHVDVDASYQPQTIHDGEKKESPMPDLSLDQGVRLPVQVPLRRSTRIAERREHQKLQISIVSDIDKHIPSQETNNTPTITIGTSTSIHSEESSPNILGSIFVDGRRRSARKLLAQHG